MGEGILVRRLRMISRKFTDTYICQTGFYEYCLAVKDDRNSNMKMIAHTTEYDDNQIRASMFINLDLYISGVLDEQVAEEFLQRILRAKVKLYNLYDFAIMQIYDGTNNWFVIVGDGQWIEAHLSLNGEPMSIDTEMKMRMIFDSIYDVDEIERMCPEISVKIKNTLKKKRGSKKSTW